MTASYDLLAGRLTVVFFMPPLSEAGGEGGGRGWGHIDLPLSVLPVS